MTCVSHGYLGAKWLRDYQDPEYFRFLIANTSDFNPAEDAVAYDELRSRGTDITTIRFNQLVTPSVTLMKTLSS